MLLGPNGQPISSSQYKKAPAPALGPAFGRWAGEELTFGTAPGGAILQFNLDALTLQDYRAMRYNPQINSSLSVLTFMLHQIDWHIECEEKKIADAVEEMLRPLWTRLVRGLSQAFWCGFSPLVMEYENNVPERRIEVSKFKDLIPEDCQVRWKNVEGSVRPGQQGIPPKFKVYDGIKQWGMPDIPAENTLWYPLLMENGNYYGRKLLKAAFAPWYFSTLIHLFANRYYERFGEPIPIGRAPFDDEFPTNDPNKVITGKEAMEAIIMQLRNRSTVVLPNTTLPLTHDSTKATFEYDIEYLESQMRGADFERYLTRLDEEMSLALFTPLLLLRNADVGSHNLGVQHTQTWLWMLNAIAGDMKEYIDRYVCQRLKALNFSERAPRCQWMPHKMGKENSDILRAIITTLMAGTSAKQGVKFDIEEVGQALGMTLHEVQVVTEQKPDTGEEGDPNAPGRDDLPRGGENKDPDQKPKGVGEPRATGREISNRVRQQVEKAWRDKTFGKDTKLSMGYRKRMIQAFIAEGVASDHAATITNELYDKVEAWLPDVLGLGQSEFSGPGDFMALFDRHLDNTIEDARAAA